jgi:uncharacterized protein (DUF1800 family)
MRRSSLSGCLVVASLGITTLPSGCGSTPPPVSAAPIASTSASAIASTSASAIASSSTPPIPSSTLPPTTLDATASALHVYSRLAFGPRPGDVERIAALGPAAPAGIEAWITDQLHPERHVDAALDKKLKAFPAIGMTTAQLLDAYPRPDKKTDKKADAKGKKEPEKRVETSAGDKPPFAKRPAEVDRELAAAKTMRAVEADAQLQEVLVDFWFNHFNVDVSKGEVKWLAVGYERDAIRPHVFGKFRDLLGAVAHHPAMLFYLDNWLSAHDGFVAGGDGKRGKKEEAKPIDEHTKRQKTPEKAAPKRPKATGLNENYGRELLELHTLGVDGGYTQTDVRETARAFTGWTIERPREIGEYLFRPKMHDEGDVTIVGQTFSGAMGEREGEAVLDMLAKHPKTAHFIAKKLCARFVADDPPPALVDRVAKVFLDTDGDLRAVYRAIFWSPEFWAASAFHNKVKDPFELLVSSLRAVGAHLEPIVGAPGDGAKATPAGYGIGFLDRLGEPLYRCAPPTGYKESADAWVNAGGLLGRIQLGLTLASQKLPGVTFDLEGLGGAPVARAGDDGATIVARLGDAILHVPLADGTRATIERRLAKPSAEDDPYSDAAHEMLVSRALGLLLGSPEFQRD